MDIIDINILKENDFVKFIAPSKALVDGVIKKITKECLGITIDTRQENLIVLQKNDTVEVILVHARQAFKCICNVLGCIQNDYEQSVVVTIPKIILTIDRREYERLPIVMDIEYSILPSDSSYNNLSNVEPKFFRSFKKTYTVNISAGGVYFIVSKNEIDSKFALVSLYLKNEKIISLCEKVRTDHAEDTKHNRVAYKYNDIKSQHRQLILDFVSEKSKELSGS